MIQIRYVNKRIPKLKTRDEAADFWDVTDSAQFPEEMYPVGDTLDAVAYRWLRREHPKRDGWIIASSPFTSEGDFADFIVRNDREQVLVEVQARRVLPSTIARVKRLQKTFGATSALLLCTGDARITDKTRAIAQRSGVRMARLPEQRASRNSAKRALKVAEAPARYQAS